jgi:hypothetical protein
MNFSGLVVLEEKKTINDPTLFLHDDGATTGKNGFT